MLQVTPESATAALLRWEMLDRFPNNPQESLSDTQVPSSLLIVEYKRAASSVGFESEMVP